MNFSKQFYGNYKDHTFWKDYRIDNSFISPGYTMYQAVKQCLRTRFLRYACQIAMTFADAILDGRIK